MQAKTSLFPKNTENIFLGTTNVSQSEFSCLAFQGLADLGFLMGDCYPLHIFEEDANDDHGTIDFGATKAPEKKDGVSDWALSHFREKCKDSKITKLDIFHYVYGVLNSPDYLAKFAQDARKSGPKVPIVEDFGIFAEAGKKLLALHLNYDKLEPSSLTNLIVRDRSLKDEEGFRVKKMSLSKSAQTLTLVINQNVSISDIPVEVLNYTVNGRSPIEWFVNQYQEMIDKDTKIVNDPNDLSSDPMYLVKLAQSLIKLSIESNYILESLPKLKIINN
jgi:predicted helicase